MSDAMFSQRTTGIGEGQNAQTRTPRVPRADEEKSCSRFGKCIIEV